MRRRWPGSPTWAASTSTRTRCGRTISTTPTSCAWTSTRCRVCPGRRCAQVALVAREALEAVGLVGWPKTSGSRGIHINVRIERALDVSTRSGARRWPWRATSSSGRPRLATSKWWKEERHGVFLDYNQNAKDRTVASAYSVRPTPDARVSMPLDWDDVARRRCRRLHAGDGASARSPRAATGARASTTPSARSRRSLSSPRVTRRRDGAMPRGRRTTASRTASRLGSSPRSVARPGPPVVRRGGVSAALADGSATQQQAAHRDRARRAQGGRHGWAGTLEVAPPRRRGAP